MWTREMVSGRMVVVEYSYPRWLLLRGPSLLLRAAARASEPKIREISWTRALVSRALVVLSRSWESLAWRQGWEEMWTLGGSD
jgi:hypothetical protein